MANIQYIGARYVPKYYTNTQDDTSSEWESNISYDYLVIVTYNGVSYISRKNVPSTVGSPYENGAYWCKLYDAPASIEVITNNINAIKQMLNSLFIDIKSMGARGDGITDDSAIIQDALNLSALSGIPAYLCAGTYLISNQLSFPSNAQLVGCSSPHSYGTTGLKTILMSNLTDHAKPLINISDGLNDYDIDNTHRADDVLIKNIELQSGTQTQMCAIFGSFMNTRLINVRISNFNIGIIITNSYRSWLNTIHTAGCKVGCIIDRSNPLMTFNKCWFNYLYDLALASTPLDNDIMSIVNTFAPNASGYTTGLLAHDCENMGLYECAFEGVAYGIDADSASCNGDYNDFERINKALIRARTSSGNRRLRSVINLTNTIIYIDSAITTCKRAELSYNVYIILGCNNVFESNLQPVEYTGATHNAQAFCMYAPQEGYYNEGIIGVTDPDGNQLDISVVNDKSHFDEHGYFNVDFFITDFTNWASNGIKIVTEGSNQDMNIYMPIYENMNDDSVKCFHVIRQNSSGDGFYIRKNVIGNTSSPVVPSDVLNGRLHVKFKYRAM